MAGTFNVRYTVRISPEGKKTLAYLRNIPYKIDTVSKLECWNLAQIGASELVQSAINAGITNFEGHLLKYGDGIRPVKIAEGKNKGQYGIIINDAGQYLDRMPEHDVWVYKHAVLQRWADKKIRKGFRGKLHVRPHHFILNGFNRMAKRADLTIQRIVSQI